MTIDDHEKVAGARTGILPQGSAGADVGATLCKLVYQGDRLLFHRLPSSDSTGIRAWLDRHQPESLGVTGGGSGSMLRYLRDLNTQRVPEFEAWGVGAPLVARHAGGSLPEPCVVVSVGTGTSILAFDPDGIRRLGGSALGGGVIVGLGSLLAANGDFEELARLAASGDRRRVDLLVGDVYPQGGIELPADLNAASFGKLHSRRPEDLMAAVMGLVGENVALLATAHAQGAEIASIVYCGSTLEGNPALEHVLSMATTAFGRTPLYLSRGAYCGALGAAAVCS